MTKIESELQTADIFTKPLSSDLFFKHCRSLGLTHRPTAQCTKCSLTFVTKNTLHKHIRSMHDNNTGNQTDVLGSKRAAENSEAEYVEGKKQRK